MTQHVQTTTTAVQLVPAARIEGTREQIGAALRRYHAEGRLVEFTQPQLIPGGRGQLYVTVRLLPAPQAHQPPARRRRTGVYVLAAGGLLVAAAIGWLVVAAIAWITTHIAIVLAALFVLAVLGATGGRRACKTVITITHWH
jgi:hypothetical protein